MLTEPKGVMLRPMTMRTVVGALLVLAMAGCGASDDVEDTSNPAALAAPSAEALCAGAAERWQGSVAAARAVTVAEVRSFVSDPHGASTDPSAPRPGAVQYAAGWEDLPDSAEAAACYLDGAVPKGPPPALDGTVQPSFDRRLVVAAEGAQPFMVSAGYRDAMPADPLTRRSG